jgi:hypothetical protein
LEKKEMQLSICGSYADASDRAVFPAAVNNKKIGFLSYQYFASKLTLRFQQEHPIIISPAMISFYTPYLTPPIDTVFSCLLNAQCRTENRVRYDSRATPHRLDSAIFLLAF